MEETTETQTPDVHTAATELLTMLCERYPATFRHEEWAATMEVNAPTFAHAIVTTSAALDSALTPSGGRS